LKADESARFCGKRTNVITRGSAPKQWLFRHGSICKYSYILSTPKAEGRLTQRCSRRAARRGSVIRKLAHAPLAAER
jgi:hypothetical protein